MATKSSRTRAQRPSINRAAAKGKGKGPGKAASAKGRGTVSAGAAKSGPASVSTSYLKKTDVAVRSQLTSAVTLPVFLATAGGLTLAERQLIVEQALVLLEQNYVHL